MSDDSLTLRVLIDIRDGVRGTNERLDTFQHEVREELVKVRSEIAATRSELRAEIAETRSELRADIASVEIRAATRTIEQTAATRDLYAMLRDRFDLRDRVEQCERDIAELKKQVG